MRRLWLLFISLCGLAFAQREALRIGDGVLSPKLLRQVEPVYPSQAIKARVQGSVVLGLVIDEKGEPGGIEIISPLGFGLEEEAIECVRKWRFAPGTKNGKPVPVYAVIEVNFRLLGSWLDAGAEKRRSEFNLALSNLRRDDAMSKERGLQSLQKLAKDKYAAAEGLLGFFYFTGKELPKDEAKGLQLLEQSGKKDEPFALAELGKMYLSGIGVPESKQKGIAMLKKASVMGSSWAQFNLGKLYQDGADVEKDLAFAKRQFRLCASKGDAACQYHLGKLMLVDGALERDRIQAISWLDLAGKKLPEAAAIAATAKAGLTPTQIKWTENLKGQLVRKQ